MTDTKNVMPNEVERRRLDEHTIQSIYQAGYSVITVKSIFGTGASYPDLLYRIIQRKLDISGIS